MIAKNLQKLKTIKEEIKKAIIDKGGNVGDTFADYPGAIRKLEEMQINVKDAGIKFGHSSFTEIPSIYDFSDVTDAAQMFLNSNITSLKNFNAENIEDFTSAFYGCRNLVDISNLKISSATTCMYRTFDGCYNLPSIDVSKWDTSNVRDWSGLFENCSNLKEVNLKGLNLLNLTSINSLFRSCDKLTTIHGVIDVPKCESEMYNTASPFKGCYNLQNFEGMTSKGTIDYSSCYILTPQSVRNIFNTLPATTYSRTVYFSQDVINQMTDDEIAVATSKGWKISPSKSISERLLLTDLSQIPSKTYYINPYAYDLSQYKGMWGNSSSSLPCKTNLWKFDGDISATSDASGMFGGCTSLRYVKLTGTNNLTNMSNIFNGCYNLEDVNIADTSNVENMDSSFSSCSKINWEPLKNWDVSKVISMNNTFYNCDGLHNIDFNWDISSVKDMTQMFASCDGLEIVEFPWDLSNVDFATGMFTRSSIKEITINGSMNGDASNMFNSCSSLTSITLTGDWSKASVSNILNGVWTTGTLYYNPQYDYSNIINQLPAKWVAKPIE